MKFNFHLQVFYIKISLEKGLFTKEGQKKKIQIKINEKVQA